MYMFLNPKQALEQIHHYMKIQGRLVQTERWQAKDIRSTPGSQMVELLHYPLAMKLPTEDLNFYRKELYPNLPWADNHFEERVCGYPINPGVEWANWPWAGKASESLDSRGQFNHNYMERYWPKLAYLGHGIATETPEEFREEVLGGDDPSMAFLSMGGLRHEYGDLENLLCLLRKEPDTRQAYFPVWFPEDTGDVHTGRKPCTLGYHFIVRDGKLDITYYIRSCDYYRHFRDDVYMTIRLGLWILHQLRESQVDNDYWDNVTLGRLVMNITSLHMFVNDYTLLYKQKPQG